jgi:Pro-kumamolisin, activation domain
MTPGCFLDKAYAQPYHCSYTASWFGLIVLLAAFTILFAVASISLVRYWWGVLAWVSRKDSTMKNIRMFKPSILIVLVLVIVGLVGVTSYSIHAFASPAVNPRLTVHGHMVKSIEHNTPVQATPNGQSITLSIALNLRNQSELDALLAAQQNPSSPQYQRFLTSAEFLQRYSPSVSTVRSVVDYLTKQGFKIGSVSSNHTLINTSGTVAQVENAFNVKLSNYTVDGRTVYAPQSEPSVPSSLGNVIGAIGGLDDVAQYKPQMISVPNSGPSGGYTPTELRTAYDVNPLISAGYDGTGQTVAIFELDGYKSSDVDTYLSHYGLGSGKYTNVLVDGATTAAGSGAGEVELDMEVVSALAPGATQKIYIGPNSGSGVNDTYNRIVTDNVAKVVSISWGLCEASSGTSELQALDNIFKQGAAQGISFFSASGDSGAYDCGGSTLGVDSPSGDPYVTGVGGTTLSTGSGGSYSKESTWSGSGGGYSSYFAKPSYQTGTGISSSNKRGVPDVSTDADPNSGYSVYCTVGAGGWSVFGGTSAAAPSWSAIAADTNSYLVGQKKAVLGNANATLYRLFNTSQTYAAYHDITSGNNQYYNAAAGYDPATGIGTPDAWNFARDAAENGGTPAPTPTSGPNPTPTTGPNPTPTIVLNPSPTKAPTSGPTPPPTTGPNPTPTIVLNPSPTTSPKPTPTATPVPTGTPPPTGLPYNNIGITNDGSSNGATYDWVGNTYSAQQLTAAGFIPGTTVTVNGVSYVWPDAPVGAIDNVVAKGQTILLTNAKTGATQLTFLGSSTNGPSQGTVKITYTDGTSFTAQLGFSDWTLNGGKSTISLNNGVAAKTSHRNLQAGTNEQVLTYVFVSAPIALDATKKVASVTLPSSVDKGMLHVFAIGEGTGSNTAVGSFSTDFESGSTQPTWSNTVDSGGYPAGGSSNVGGILSSLSGPEAAIRTEYTHSGKTALMYSGNDTGASTSYAYLKVFDFSGNALKVDANTTLTYWIFPQSAATTNLVSGDNSSCVAIDLIFSDGKSLRDSGAVDQNGNHIHPAGQCDHLQMDTWNKVVVNLGAVANGKTITRLDVGYDQSANTGGYRGYIDDISIK